MSQKQQQPTRSKYVPLATVKADAVSKQASSPKPMGKAVSVALTAATKASSVAATKALSVKSADIVSPPVSVANPALSVASHFRTAPLIANLPPTSGTETQALVVGNDIDTTSILVGGINADNAVGDVYDIAKSDIVYAFPTGDAGATTDTGNYYYTTAKQYKVETQAPTIRLVVSPDQKVVVKNLNTGPFSYVVALFVIQSQDGTIFHHKTEYIAPLHPKTHG